jgi:hypothetical protein
MYEWANPYWYTIRCGALQAGPVYVKGASPADVDHPEDARVDEEATACKVATLIGAFKGYCVTLPCAECRTHYAADWEVYPFTAEHALDYKKAMQWVEALTARIEARKDAERRAKAKDGGGGGAGTGAAAATTDSAGSAAAQGRPLMPASLQGHRGAPYRGAAGRVVRRPATAAAAGGGAQPPAAATTRQQTLAIKSALLQTAKGGQGCKTCGAARGRRLAGAAAHR